MVSIGNSHLLFEVLLSSFLALDPSLPFHGCNFHNYGESTVYNLPKITEPIHYNLHFNDQ